jgi:hypothetical protein
MDKVSEAVAARAKDNFQSVVEVAKRAKQRSVELSAEEARVMKERRAEVSVLRSRPSPYQLKPEVPPRGAKSPEREEDVRARVTRLEAEKKAASDRGLSTEPLKSEIAQCQQTLRVFNLQRKIVNLKKLQRETPTDGRARKLEELMETLVKLRGHSSKPAAKPEALAAEFQRAAKALLDADTYRRVLAEAKRALE